MVSFMHEQSVICSQTQLDDIAHEQTIICIQLFAGHMRGGLSANEKEKIFASNDNLGPSFQVPLYFIYQSVKIPWLQEKILYIVRFRKFLVHAK